jgi:hypothetical protein
MSRGKIQDPGLTWLHVGKTKSEDGYARQPIGGEGSPHLTTIDHFISLANKDACKSCVNNKNTPYFSDGNTLFKISMRALSFLDLGQIYANHRP